MPCDDDETRVDGYTEKILKMMIIIKSIKMMI